MNFRTVLPGFSGGMRLVVIDDEAAAEIGVKPLDRVVVKKNGCETVAIVTVAKQLPRNVVALYDEVAAVLGAREGDEVFIEPAEPPRSLKYIRERLRGGRFTEEEVRAIAEDALRGLLSEVELSALVVALHFHGMSIEENYYFTKAMVETGERLDLGVKPVLDKHSLGGVPGDKTTMLVVPIVASLGFKIPKTSSRAITSPAGTADRVEVLCPVNLSIEEMKEVVMKTNGCMVWGGALRLAPLDDIIIRVEYPLSIDPFYMPSIMAKKAAVGATHVVLDIPVGRGGKVKTIGQGHALARDFIELANRLGMRLRCVLTYGEQPIGYGVGPALEAREALMTLMGRGPRDLVDKAASVAGTLLEMVGVKNGKQTALEVLRSGKAERKFREIVEAQGGDPGVKPGDIPVGEHKAVIKSTIKGSVLWINNGAIAQIARAAGAPKDKGAGVLLNVKIGDLVRAGDVLMEIYAEKSYKLELAEKLVNELSPIGVGDPLKQMLVGVVPAEKPHAKWTIIER